MNRALSILLSLAILAGCAIVCIAIGINIGRQLAEADFEAARRGLGDVFSEIKTEINENNYATANKQITFIVDNWYSIDFFRNSPSEKRTDWVLFFRGFDKIKEEPK